MFLDAEKNSVKASEELEKILKALEDADTSEAGLERMARIKAAMEAKEYADRAARKAAKAKAKAEDAGRKAEELGALPRGEETKEGDPLEPPADPDPKHP
jgi:hypothetical protein